jgi:hypothetical protein
MNTLFDQHCRELSELSGVDVAPPRSDPDSGAMATQLMLHEAEVDFMAESPAAESLFTRVHFGALDAADRTAWGELLEINFALAGDAAPIFSRDPASGDVLLQQRWPRDTQINELLATLERQCRAARAWREASDVHAWAANQRLSEWVQ